MRPRRSDLWILGGLLAFGLVFILGATWLGSTQRARYALDPLPPLDAAEAELVSALTILTPRYSEGLAWLRADDGGRADIADRLSVGGLETAVIRVLQGRPEEAVEAALHGLSENGDDGELHFVLGIALERTGDPEGAAVAYVRAERALAGDVDVLFTLARLHFSSGRYREAREYAERLVLKAPRHAEGQRVLGESCLATHDMGRAKRAFHDVLQLRPHDDDAQARIKFLDGTQ